MRAISKLGDGGFHLKKSHANPPQTHGAATSRWKSFGHKPEVMELLLSEQYRLCCYSELRSDQQGLSYHIEHVENKGQQPHRTFDYTNLAASALASDSDLPALKALGVEVFGGHAPGKRQSVDMQRFVSCHQADCSRFFAYLSDGRVVPAHGLETTDQERAQYTIDLLNLNSSYLVPLRRKWWAELEVLFDEHITSDMSLHCLAGVDLLPRNQTLNPFFSLTRQFFGRIAEDVIRQEAPELL